MPAARRIPSAHHAVDRLHAVPTLSPVGDCGHAALGWMKAETGSRLAVVGGSGGTRRVALWMLEAATEAGLEDAAGACLVGVEELEAATRAAADDGCEAGPHCLCPGCRREVDDGGDQRVIGEGVVVVVPHGDDAHL